jgi:hypothetical protein
MEKKEHEEKSEQVEKEKSEKEETEQAEDEKSDEPPPQTDKPSHIHSRSPDDPENIPLSGQSLETRRRRKEMVKAKKAKQ